jgi:hypothetical protein
LRNKELKILEDELGILYITKYLELRKALRLGPVWKTGFVVEFSEPDDILERRQLPLGEYKRQKIDYWYPSTMSEIKKEEVEKLQRIGPKRDDRAKWNRGFYGT